MRSSELKRENSGSKGILFPVLVLLSLGAVIVYTSSSFLAQSCGFKGGQFYYLLQHLLRISIGFLALIFFSIVPVNLWKYFAWKILIFTVLLLLSLFFIGKVSNGARRSLHFVFINFQPSELARLALILFLAAFLSERKRLRSFFKGFLPAVLVILAISGIIAIQPDISTAFMLFAIGGGMLFYAGAKIWHLSIMGILGTVLLLFALHTFPHARSRIQKFKSPESNYQVTQAKIGISEGKVLGVGVGKGKEKFLYLPEPHTDFIFAVIGEELGFVGASFVILLFLLLGFYGFNLAQNLMRRDLYGSILAFGITLSFLLYSFTNISVVLGLIPTTGLPLPFVSFGGSSLLFNMSAVGILIGLQKKASSRKRR